MPGMIYPTWFATHGLKPCLEFLAWKEAVPATILTVVVTAVERGAPYTHIDTTAAAVWMGVRNVYAGPDVHAQRAGLGELWFFLTEMPQNVATTVSSAIRCPTGLCVVRAAVATFPSGARSRLRLLDLVGSGLESCMPVGGPVDLLLISEGEVVAPS